MSTIADPLGQKDKIKPLWRNRDYLILTSGNGISAIGSQVSLVAFPLLCLALTHSPAQAGLMSAVRNLPTVLLMLPAGALVDRWDRKRLMIVCDTGRALALGSIPFALWLGHLSSLQLYVVALLEGTLAVFFSLAMAASIPRIVEQEQIPDATAQEQTIESLAGTIGPTLGPILYGLGGMIPFLTDAISYACSVVSLLFIKTRFQEERVADGAGISSLWKEIKEGMVWLWHSPLLRFLALHTFGLITPCYGYVLLIIVLGQRLHVSDVTLGLIFGAGGLGSILGAVVITPLYRRFGFYKVLVGTTWLWALGWLLYAFAPNAWVLGIGNVIGFVVVPMYMVVQYSYRLKVTPDHLQGRVNSVFRLIAFGGQPLGMWITGLLLQWVGPINAVLLLFLPQGILAIAVTFNRRVRNASL